MAKINGDALSYPNCVFLGGTCSTSTWRNELIPMFDKKVDYFDPQLPPGAWNKKAAAQEDACKKVAKVLVFVISPEGLGTYSGFEISECSSKRPSEFVFCAIGDLGDQTRGVDRIKDALRERGITVCDNLEEVAAVVNDRLA